MIRAVRAKQGYRSSSAGIAMVLSLALAASPAIPKEQTSKWRAFLHLARYDFDIAYCSVVQNRFAMDFRPTRLGLDLQTPSDPPA
jgi:hypothetical protein